MKEPLLVALTFDAETDVFDNSIDVANATPRASWRGVDEAIPRIRRFLGSLQDSDGRAACATWFVRSDDQMGALTGDPGYLLEHYRSLWRDCRDAGDEIALHAHLHVCRDGHWTQETEPRALAAQLRRTHHRFSEAGFEVRTSRIGEAFCSNEIMRTLDELGVASDCTAMPGRVRIDGSRRIDWRPTPDRAYWPDTADYRVEGQDKSDTSAVLEIPMSMVRTRAAYDAAPIRRYLDPSFHADALAVGLAETVEAADLLVTVTHPSSVLPIVASTAHGLLSFSFTEFERNVRRIVKLCCSRSRPFRFVTLGDAVRDGSIRAGMSTSTG